MSEVCLYATSAEIDELDCASSPTARRRSHDISGCLFASPLISPLASLLQAFFRTIMFINFLFELKTCPALCRSPCNGRRRACTFLRSAAARRRHHWLTANLTPRIARLSVELCMCKLSLLIMPQHTNTAYLSFSHRPESAMDGQ